MQEKHEQVLTHPEYMGQSTEAFASLADALLIVEGKKLPVHSTILAANSNVFAEMFVEATERHPISKHLLEVPLPGDSLKDVSTALQYLYKGCTVWLGGALVISGPDDAMSLAKFAHKYGIEPLLQACENSLVAAVGQISRGSRAFEQESLGTIELMARVTDLAETCGMKELLGHCEFFMITSGDKSLWAHPALLSDQVSRHSLLTMLRAFANLQVQDSNNQSESWEPLHSTRK